MERHNIPPVFDEKSEILILGSFPSVKSREDRFFYAHKQNRFWQVMAELLGESVPQTVEEKKTLLLKNHIALWDVIASCDIDGSSDSKIRNVVPNDLRIILDTADIRSIYCNGGKAYELFRRYPAKETGRDAVRLPSTSPANASFSFPELVSEWKIILGGLNQ